LADHRKKILSRVPCGACLPMVGNHVRYPNYKISLLRLLSHQQYLFLHFEHCITRL